MRKEAFREIPPATWLVTGGAGFIGSAVVRYLLGNTDATVINVDKLTYAGNLESIAGCLRSNRHHFFRTDICDGRKLREIFAKYRPNFVMHLAAESHVDRSIDGPSDFVMTNVVGTCTMLEAAREFWAGLSSPDRDNFRFLHVSTDEVYGDLGHTGALFNEATPYRPSSPYSASKAGSDHLVRAWHRTFGLPIVLTNCSNNYGPFQFPEKLIPLAILNAVEGKEIPVYGDGENIRDWLFVEDHVDALVRTVLKGQPGETYLVGGRSQVRNIDVVKTICAVLDEVRPRVCATSEKYESLIQFVPDRPGHDFCYGIDFSKFSNELGWAPKESFGTGIRKTVQWYLDNLEWCRHVQDGSYRRERLGLSNEAARGKLK